MNAKFTLRNLVLLSLLAIPVCTPLLADQILIGKPALALRIQPEHKAEAEDAEATKKPEREDAEEDDEPEEPTPVPEDLIEFLSGDRLHGKMLGIEPKRGVSWERSDVTSPIDFKLENIDAISLETLDSTADRKPGDARVRLFDGSDFPATLVSVDGDAISLSTWYAGDLSVKRSAVESLTMAVESDGIIYSGPDSLDGWEQQNRNDREWKFSRGGFVGTRSAWIGRDFKDLPDQVRIDFDLQWVGQFSVVLALLPENLANYGSGSYSIQLNSGYAYMYRNTDNGNQNLGQVEIERLRRTNNARIGVRLDREAKTIALLVDGEMVKQWKDSGKWSAKGNGVVFYGQGQGPIRISRIEIAGWDGKIPSLSGREENLEQDLVTLVNGDKVSGKLEAIGGDEVRLSTSFAPELKIPMERVSKVEFAGKRPKTQELPEGSVRGHFAGDGSLVFSVQSMTRESLDVQSESFGTAKIKPSAFKELEFNLGEPRDKDLDLMERGEFID